MLGKINYKIILNLLLILVFIINPIFAGNDPNDPNNEDEESSGFFSGLWEDGKEVMLTPARGVITLYSENVKTFQSIVNPWEDSNNDGKNPYTEKIGPLFYYTFNLVYYVLLIWLDFIVFLALFSASSEEAYFQHKTRVRAFLRTCGAVMISGIVASIIITFMMGAIKLFSATGLDVALTPDNLGWYNFMGGLILGTLLYILSFALLTIGYISAIFIGLGYVLIAVTYVMKKSAGPMQTIGSYMFFQLFG